MSLSGIPAAVAAEASGNEPYIVPATATPVKNKPNKMRWSEVGRVRLLKTYRRDDKPYQCFQISVDIGPEGSGENAGRRFTRTFNLNTERLSQPAPQTPGTDGQWMMCVITTRLLKQLLVALDLPSRDETGAVPADSLNAAFTESGTGSDYIGAYVSFEMVQEAKPILDENGVELRKEYNSDFDAFHKYGG